MSKYCKKCGGSEEQHEHPAGTSYGCSFESRSEGDKYDVGKARFDLVHPIYVEGTAAVLTHGAKKYAPNNWQLVPDAKARYTAALLRHINAWQQGERLDPESGIHHLLHASCNLMFLVYFEFAGYRETDEKS